MPYPATVEEVVRPVYRFRRGVLAVMKQFKSLKPWSGSVEERKRKFQWPPRLTFRNIRVPAPPGASTRSWYSPALYTICIEGKLSVLTLLHEFAHALHRGEYGAAKWSINLFRRVFPRQFRRLVSAGHVLVSRT